MSNEKKISYRRVGDYLIPNLKLPPEETKVTLGKWGMLYKDYIQKNKSPLFNSLLIKGKLYQHCAEIEKHARDMYDSLIEQMKVTEKATEQLKEQDQWEWVQRMSSIEQRAKEIVLNEFIYI